MTSYLKTKTGRTVFLFIVFVAWMMTGFQELLNADSGLMNIVGLLSLVFFAFMYDKFIRIPFTQADNNL